MTGLGPAPTESVEGASQLHSGSSPSLAPSRGPGLAPGIDRSLVLALTPDCGPQPWPYSRLWLSLPAVALGVVSALLLAGHGQITLWVSGDHDIKSLGTTKLNESHTVGFDPIHSKVIVDFSGAGQGP